MKRKGILILVMMVLALTLKTQAATYSTYLPGGKNYINPENFRLRNETIESIESFKVLPNQTYTLTYPGDDMFFDSYLTIASSSATYADGIAMNLSQCDVDQYLAICTFTTSSNEESIYVRISSVGTTQYYQHYKMGDIQLEEGSSSTSHEPYIAPALDIEEPSFSETGAFILSYLDETPIETIIGDHITVHDDIDGDLSNQIIVESDTYTANKTIVGAYIVSLSATDSSGNTATFDLTVIVKDEIAPVIDGPLSINVSVDDSPSIASLIAQYYTIEDEYDGTLSHVVTNDTYTANKDTVGSYNISFKATDSSSNATSKSVSITVYDDVAPTIDGVSSLTSPMSNPLSIDDILATQTVSDNYTNLSIANVIVTDGFTSNELMSGMYDIVLSVEDSSGNQCNKTISIEVKDDIAPVISGPITYVDSYTKNLVLEDIISLLSISDNYDILSINNLIVINDTFTNRSSEIGTFSISFSITDGGGNTGTHEIAITIVDDMPPVIYVDSYIINVSTDVTFTSEDALMLMLNTNELSPGEYEVVTLIDEYEGNEQIEGSYLYKVAFTSDKGDVIEKEFIIKVQNDPSIMEEYLSIRNVILYGVSILLVGFIVYKVKK